MLNTLDDYIKLFIKKDIIHENDKIKINVRRRKSGENYTTEIGCTIVNIRKSKTNDKVSYGFDGIDKDIDFIKNSYIDAAELLVEDSFSNTVYYKKFHLYRSLTNAARLDYVKLYKDSVKESYIIKPNATMIRDIINNHAEKYYASSYYSVGEYCLRENKIMKCIREGATGKFNKRYWVESSPTKCTICFTCSSVPEEYVGSIPAQFKVMDTKNILTLLTVGNSIVNHKHYLEMINYISNKKLADKDAEFKQYSDRDTASYAKYLMCKSLLLDYKKVRIRAVDSGGNIKYFVIENLA